MKDEYLDAALSRRFIAGVMWKLGFIATRLVPHVKEAIHTF
jgi:hypothetical protein